VKVNERYAYDPEEVSLKVGLEVHRQLSTGRKLFCSCGHVKEDGEVTFVRRLRPSQGELGEVDQAALFEAGKDLWMVYHSGPNSSCLVEADEEPPHDLDREALESAIMIASLFRSNVVDEVHVMRKIVIDGSNTTGFQRTMVVATGGSLKTSAGEVAVLSLTLEEDAARILEEKEGRRDFALDRLGIPLIEVSLAPVTAPPDMVEEVAAEVGRLLKSSGRVARGLGTVRQDINVSVMGGPVVEVKGVQRLDLVAKVVDYEAKRQLWLLELARRLVEEGVKEADLSCGPVDLTPSFSSTGCELIRGALRDGLSVYGLRAAGFAGHLGEEPYPNVRLGRELADMARFYKLGGLLHSDELPGYGVTEEEVAQVRRELKCAPRDAFILLVGEPDRVLPCLRSIAERLRQALSGPPAETRGPITDGSTRFVRPRPGAARMYPETDIPPIPIGEDDVRMALEKLPPPWDAQVRDLMQEHGLSRDQADRLLDSEHYDLFKKAVKSTKLAPTFLAAFLTETLVSLQREGLDTGKAGEELLMQLFEEVSSGRLAKEGAPEVLRQILSGKGRDIQEAIRALGLRAMSDEELTSLILATIEENEGLVKSKGQAAFGLLMGRVMAKARGRVDGAKVSAELKKNLRKALAKTEQ